MGVGNKIWGEAGFVMLGLDDMVIDRIWSKRSSGDGLGDPIVSTKARLGQQGHCPLRSLVSRPEQDQGIGTSAFFCP